MRLVGAFLAIHLPNRSLVSAMARSILAGKPEVEQIAKRLAHTLGHDWQWLRPLARRYAKLVADKARLRHRDVVDFLDGDEGFQRACVRHRDRLRIQHWMADPQEMQPVAAAEAWDLPVMASVADLAEWLTVSAEESWLGSPT